MKLGVLYSGGKDSTLALMKAKEKHEIVCLITLRSANKESYMFHTPNIDITQLQAEAMQIPLLTFETKGEKEKELVDLKKSISEAKQKYKLDGIVTGALCSKYQADRIQKICDDLELRCVNPLWQMNQIKLLNELLEKKIRAIIVGVFAEPLDKTFLGKEIDAKMIERLAKAEETHKINPAGEGGEIETTVIDAPCFNKKIEILNSEIKYQKDSGVFLIVDAKLTEK